MLSFYSERTSENNNNVAVDPQEINLFFKALQEYIDKKSLAIRLQEFNPVTLYTTLSLGFKAENELFITDVNQHFYKILGQLRGINAIADQLKTMLNIERGEFQSPFTPFDQLVQSYEELEVNHAVINRKLKEWKKSQALTIIDHGGSTLTDNLNDIKICIQTLLQVLRKLSKLTMFLINWHILNKDQKHQLNKIYERLTEIIELNNIVPCLIVEEQPPQVMKTDTKFSATVRWSIDSESFNEIHTDNVDYVVECYILNGEFLFYFLFLIFKFCTFSEQQTCKLNVDKPRSSLNLLDLTALNEKTGTILKNTCNLEYIDNAFLGKLW